MLFAGVRWRCSPTVRGDSDLWLGRLAGGAICGRSGAWVGSACRRGDLRAERLAGGAALGSGVVAGDVETSPLPRQVETNELARVAGEGCTVFPQTLTNPAHSPPSRRGGRRPGWCLRRRRQAAARPTARQRNRQLHSVWTTTAPSLPQECAATTTAHRDSQGHALQTDPPTRK